VDLTETQVRKNNFSRTQMGYFNALDRVIDDWRFNVGIDLDDLIEVLSVLRNEYLEEAGIDETGGDYS
jgi:hypothetical protein